LPEPGPDTWIKAVWRWQILGLLILGPSITLRNSWSLGRVAQAHSLESWFVLGLIFATGLVIFEGLQRRRWTSADLDADQGPSGGEAHPPPSRKDTAASRS